MPNDYYADAPAPAEPMPSETESAEPEAESSDSQTAVLPKAVLGGKDFQPGEEVVLEVVQVMEDSVLVKYASGEEEPTEEPAEEPPAAAPAPAGPGGGMASLMQ